MIPVLFLTAAGLAADPAPKPVSAREALQPFNVLVGSWRGTGYPEGTREERQAGFWTEATGWGWQFKDQDAWLTVTFDKHKYFTRGELRFVSEKNAYHLPLTAPDKSSQIYTGPLKDKTLTLDRTDGPAGEQQ